MFTVLGLGASRCTASGKVKKHPHPSTASLRLRCKKCLSLEQSQSVAGTEVWFLPASISRPHGCISQKGTRHGRLFSPRAPDLNPVGFGKNICGARFFFFQEWWGHTGFSIFRDWLSAFDLDAPSQRWLMFPQSTTRGGCFTLNGEAVWKWAQMWGALWVTAHLFLPDEELIWGMFIAGHEAYSYIMILKITSCLFRDIFLDLALK